MRPGDTSSSKHPITLELVTCKRSYLCSFENEAHRDEWLHVLRQWAGLPGERGPSISLSPSLSFCHSLCFALLVSFSTLPHLLCASPP